MLKKIRSVIYPSNDLEADITFWTKVLGREPYFKESYYVGFNVDGNELGLDPNAAEEGINHPVALWLVDDTEKAIESLTKDGATQIGTAQDVGGGMKMARLKDVSGNIFGIIDEKV